MSKATIGTSTENQRTTNFDSSIIFLWDNKYESGSFTNDEYDDLPLPGGTLMGRVSATDKLVPLKSDASDGSQFPVGILTQDHTILGGETKAINICIGGEVAKEKIILDAGDSFETVIDGRRIKDRIASDTAGIILIEGQEQTGLDNQ